MGRIFNQITLNPTGKATSHTQYISRMQEGGLNIHSMVFSCWRKIMGKDLTMLSFFFLKQIPLC